MPFPLRSWLGWLNFLLLQWFCIRLARIRDLRDAPDGSQHSVTIGYTLLRWPVPLTGWWSRYIWIRRSGRWGHGRGLA